MTELMSTPKEKKMKKPLNAQEYLYNEAYRRLEEKQAKQERMRENREKSSAKTSAGKKLNLQNSQKQKNKICQPSFR